ncbi:(Fe-S)-binding protein [Desulfocurvus sp. DL9XJH121]
MNPEHDNHTTGPKAEPQCILCGKCLEVCPLLAATGREELSPRAKLFVLQRLRDDPGALSRTDARKLASLCLTCGRCAKACTQGVDVPATVSRLRAGHPDFRRWLWRAWIQGSGLLWPAAARLGTALGGLVSAGHGAAARTGRSLAAMGRGSAIRPWIEFRGLEACPRPGKVVLFPGCLARSVRTRWTATARELLTAAGAEVLPEPRWSCCGGTLGHAGLAGPQFAAMRANVDAWREAGRPRLVTFCASCWSSLAAYPQCADLGLDQDEARAWTEALTPLSELLAGASLTATNAVPDELHYHRPCHAPAKDPDARLLARAAGERLDRGDGKACCGLGGVLQLAAPELSARVADNLWERMAAGPGAQVLTGCSGCWLQLSASAPEGVAVAHWLDAVAHIESPAHEAGPNAYPPGETNAGRH